METNNNYFNKQYEENYTIEQRAMNITFKHIVSSKGLKKIHLTPDEAGDVARHFESVKLWLSRKRKED